MRFAAGQAQRSWSQQKVAAADGGWLWPSRDFCMRVGRQGSGRDGERTDGASDGFARFRELMRARALAQ